MLRALLAAVSGLRNHQLRLDVIGNNIANVNTVGYKASRVTFQEGFAQVLASASRSTLNQGGVNPSQVGSGVNRGSVDANFNQGGFLATGQPLDLAIEGNAMFVLRSGEQNVFSRAGNFTLDSDGRITLGNSGMALQGAATDADGNPTGAVGDIVLNLGDKAPAKATSQLTLSGNLDAGAEIDDVHTVSVTVYDAAGRPYQLTMTMTYAGNGVWNWEATSDDATVPSGPGTITFASDGTIESLTYPGGEPGLKFTPDEGDEFTLTIVADGSDGGAGLTAYAGASTAAVSDQDGRQAGDLVNLRIDADGRVYGIYGNGTTLSLAQISLATFANPAGLMRLGGNVYGESANSGTPIIGFSGTTTASTMFSGALENSNVDLSEEFTDMIITQRGFQANARVITAADEMLAEVIALRR